MIFCQVFLFVMNLYFGSLSKFLLDTSERFIYIRNMKSIIEDILWIEEVVDKLQWKHHVSQEEVEEVLFRNPYILFKEKGIRNTEENVYVALGTTESGRYLFVLFILKSNKEAFVLTARDMTKSERKYYEKKK